MLSLYVKCSRYVMIIRKRLAGGKARKRNGDRAYYLIIPRPWIREIERITGRPLKEVDLDLRPDSLVITPVLDHSSGGG